MTSVRTIAVTNQKGGVGKTTTVANLGAMLARRGRNVCLLDLDPQAHLTMHFGIDPGALTESIYDVLVGAAPLTRPAVLVEPNLTVIPSVIDLAAAEVELAGTVGREQILRDRLAEQALPYELMLVDCPPSLGLLTLNALSAAEEILIPLQPHFLALQGLGRLLETVSLVQRRINPGLRVAGVIFCMFESNTRLSGEVVGDVASFFAGERSRSSPWSGVRIYQTRIRRNIKLAECPSHGTTILHYEPTSHGAEDYAALADEFLAYLSQGPSEAAAAAGAYEPAPSPASVPEAEPAPSPASAPEAEPAPSPASSPGPEPAEGRDPAPSAEEPAGPTPPAS